MKKYIFPLLIIALIAIVGVVYANTTKIEIGQVEVQELLNKHFPLSGKARSTPYTISNPVIDLSVDERIKVKGDLKVLFGSKDFIGDIKISFKPIYNQSNKSISFEDIEVHDVNVTGIKNSSGNTLSAGLLSLAQSKLGMSDERILAKFNKRKDKNIKNINIALKQKVIKAPTLKLKVDGFVQQAALSLVKGVTVENGKLNLLI